MMTDTMRLWHGLTPEEHEAQYNPRAAVANFAFVAEALVASGSLAVIANYPLCPAVTLDEVVAAARDAVAWTHRHIAQFGGDPARLTVSGHSAGAHLTAAALAEDWPARGLPADIISRAVMISGIFDPAPAIGTSVNAEIRLTPELAARHDFERIAPRILCPCWIVVGGCEPWQWIDQSFRYAQHLRRHGGDPGVLAVPGRHHFDILDQVRDETSELGRIMRRRA
jgi:arylformamidase